MLNLLFELANRVGLVIMLSFVFSKTKIFKNVFTRKRKLKFSEKLIMALFYGGLGILGSYTGIAFKGAIVNTRVIGVVVGGLLGGPVVGVLAGIFAGIHRFLMDPAGMTSFGCAISTISEGLLAGYLSHYFYRSKNPVFFAWIAGTVAEVMQMSIILLIVKPYSYASNLVSIIGLPMILMNAIGIAMFVAIVQNIKTLQDSEAAFRAEQTLKIADQTIQYFRQGLNNEGAQVVSQIIYDMTDFKAVAITDEECILAHTGIGKNHTRVGTEIETDMTRHVLELGKMLVNQNTESTNSLYKDYKLNCAIIVPLKMNEKTVGTLKLYKEKVNSITLVDEELARGLGNLFSSQLELSRIEKQEALRVKAELQALQAQINPHFLFNAINTIVSLVRTEPDNARNLLIHLGDYFRNNMQINKESITIGEELKHIEAYLKIEKARFGNKLSVVYNVPEHLETMIPPLLIQPIVENAVKHGIFPKEGDGTVEISVSYQDDEMCIIVKDDGVGMSESKKNNAIGLSNVKKRLQAVYDNQFKFRIDSENGMGTQVFISVPIRGGLDD